MLKTIPAALYHELHKLPPPKLKTFDEGLEFHGKVRCACKNKVMPVEEIKQVKSKLMEGIDYTCDECMKMLKGMCPIMCAGCKEIVAHTEPGKDPDGFQLVPGEIYHIAECPVCNPEKFKEQDTAVETMFVEKQAYRRLVLNKTS